MKKFLKIITIAVLAIIATVSMVACSNTSAKTGDTGLLVKKIDGVYTIYDYVDDGKGVTTLDVASCLDQGMENVRIRAEAFKGNDTLKKIIVPETVTEIDQGAFAGMKVLEELVVPFVGRTSVADVKYGATDKAENKSVDSARTIAHFFGATEYDSAVAVTISYNSASTTTCYIPVTFNKITIKTSTDYAIPMYAFNGMSKAVKVEFEGNVTAIGEYAFANYRQLQAIDLSSVTTIYKGAFANCANLKTVTLNNAITTLGANTFEGTSLTAIDLSSFSSLQTIGNDCFKNSQLVEIKLPASVTAIGNYAFYGASKLENVYTNVQNELNIGVYAFGDCNKLSYFGKIKNKAENTINVVNCTVGAQAFATEREYTFIEQ